MKKRYIFFDIDGTLVAGGYGNTYTPADTHAALEALRKAGHFLAIATGRSQAMAVDMMRDMGFANMVSDGGNGITIDGELIGIEPLDREACILLLEEAESIGLPWGFCPDNAVVRLVPDGRFYEATQDIYMENRIVEGLNPGDYKTFYKINVACRRGEEARLKALAHLPWMRFQDEYIFIEPIDKSVGIKRIVDHFGGDYGDVVVFGDHWNDMSMFCDEWTCVAMGNAIPELKAKADFVTLDVDKGGILHACKHLGLI